MNIEQIAKMIGLHINAESAQSDCAWLNGFDRVTFADFERAIEIATEHEKNRCAKVCELVAEAHSDAMEVAHRLTAKECAEKILRV